ncbi:MAG: hypothetical protein WAM60_09085 [Candidatus Promineifilaceae bacterium]
MKWLRLLVLVGLVGIFGRQIASGQTAEPVERPPVESTSGNGTLEPVGSWPFGPALAVVADEGRNLVYLGSGGAVLILDVTDPTNPTLVSDDLRTDGLVRGLDYDPATQRLYIAANEAGLEIWDLTDPANPARLSRTEITYFDVEIPINDVALSGNYAILDGNYGYVHSVDISDPVHPVDVSFNGIGGNPTQGVYADDSNHAYACGPNFIRFNLQNGLLYSAGYFDFYSLCGDFTVDNDTTAYVGVGSYMYILSLPSFQIKSTPNVGGVNAVDVRDDTAYLLNSSGLHIYDVSNSAAISLLGETDTIGSSDLAVVGNYAYVAASAAGLQVVDISNLSQPEIVGSYDVFSVTTNVVIKGSLAFLSVTNSGLVIVDISDKAKPEIIGQFNSAGYANAVVVDGNYAYIADWEDGLRIVDISDPTQPTEVGYYDGLEVWNVAVSGNLAYAVDFDSALHILDVSNPASPQLLGMLPLSGYIWEVALDGNYLYIANEDNGVRVVDVSDPTQPVEVGSYPTLNALDVQVKDGLAYVASADWDGGFLILDVSNPAQPTLVNQYNPNGWFHPFNVNVSGIYAYLTTPSASDKLYTIDISNLTNPVEVDDFSISGSIREVTADGPFVYVSGGEAGMQIYRNTAVAYQATLGPNSTMMAEPGETITHTFTLANLGLSDTFSLTISGQSWPTTLMTPATLEMDANEDTTISVQVTVPVSPTESADTFTLTAVSSGDPSLTLTATGTTMLPPPPPPPAEYSIYLPGVWRPGL